MYTSQVLATLALAMPALVSASTLYPTMGCYSDVPDLKNMTTNVYNSYGFCTDHCRQGNYKFAVVSQGDHCACSNAVPPPSFKIDDEKCKIVCPGFPEDFCKTKTGPLPYCSRCFFSPLPPRAEEDKFSRLG